MGKKWYCCRCGDGPLNSDIIVACPNCGHYKDSSCTEKKLASPPQFSIKSSPGVDDDVHYCCSAHAPSASISGMDFDRT